MSDDEDRQAADRPRVIEFVGAAADDVAAAVEGVLVGLRTPWLREGAAQSVAVAEGDDPDAPVTASAQRFQTTLELAYLVASADGLAKAERQSLSYLLHSVSGDAIQQAALERHFSDLDHAVAALGRRERLAASAAAIDDPAGREEAVLLVSLIAMADGVLSEPEMDAVLQLGTHFEFAPEATDALIERAAKYVREALQ